MNNLKHFMLWLDEPIVKVTNKKTLLYIDFLLGKGLKPRTNNCQGRHVESYAVRPRMLTTETAIQNPPTLCCSAYPLRIRTCRSPVRPLSWL